MRRLLIVDDDAAVRKLFRLNLADDYEIIDTDDAEHALGLALEHKPDAILLDLRMPKFSGFDLCRTFSSLSKTHLIPIFVVSGDQGATTADACKELGAAGFFGKPVDFEALKARLSKIKRHIAVPRSEVRVQLAVPLKLRGLDIHGSPFEETAITENVSLSGFLCRCVAELQKDSVVQVFLARGSNKPAGEARCVRTEKSEGSGSQYGFRFIEKTSEWILQ
ncbi:MAG TPA: response regulator [Candidatus Limnocylindria bacterium]|nr:response regulator [Candidatus Limnocylindria bacterium]